MCMSEAPFDTPTQRDIARFAAVHPHIFAVMDVQPAHPRNLRQATYSECLVNFRNDLRSADSPECQTLCVRGVHAIINLAGEYIKTGSLEVNVLEITLCHGPVSL